MTALCTPLGQCGATRPQDSRERATSCVVPTGFETRVSTLRVFSWPIPSPAPIAESALLTCGLLPQCIRLFLGVSWSFAGRMRGERSACRDRTAGRSLRAWLGGRPPHPFARHDRYSDVCAVKRTVRTSSMRDHSPRGHLRTQRRWRAHRRQTPLHGGRVDSAGVAVGQDGQEPLCTVRDRGRWT
jgi:hypothetical protein